MESQIVNIVTNYSFETAILAVLINILTGLIKMPLKGLAKKTKNSEKFTRLIIFLPIILGFGITVCYRLLLNCDPLFDKNFYILWFSSSSLSLTIYAIWEKLFPSKKHIMQECEIEANQKILEVIQKMFQEQLVSKKEASVSNGEIPLTDDEQDNTTVNRTENQKIILYGRKQNREIEVKK